MGVLYLVATPIGNLEDITYRAVRILREAAVIAAEDTRTTRKLLSRYEIHTPLISFHAHSNSSRISELVARTQEGDVAVVSEAGMPSISDPGYRLVVAAIEHGVPVVPIPGPSALVAALAVSGLPTDSFTFLGFLPARAGRRRKTLDAVKAFPHTLVFYEAPHRLLPTLKDMLEVFGDRRMTVVRELTKLHEEIWRGKISEAVVYFNENQPRGEFTLVVAGAPAEAAQPAWTEETVRREVERCRREGMSLKDAAKEIAPRSGWPSRDVYRLGLESGPHGKDE